MTKYKFKSRKVGRSIFLEDTQATCKEIGTEVANSNQTIKNAFVSDYKSVENGAVWAYKKIESGVVNGYKKIEDVVVRAYKKIEGKFVDKFLEEIPEDTSNKNSL